MKRSSVDAMARRWQQIEALEDRLADKKDRLKEIILAAIRKYGEIAPDAKTMRILRGLAREIQATFPTDTDVDPAVARHFLRQVPAYVGKRLFQRSEKFALRPGAYGHACLKLTPRQLTLFNLAVRRSDGAPRVKVVKLKKAKKAA
jgi:hypothetical protein